jgi:hypothetical protein
MEIGSHKTVQRSAFYKHAYTLDRLHPISYSNLGIEFLISSTIKRNIDRAANRRQILIVRSSILRESDSLHKKNQIILLFNVDMSVLKKHFIPISMPAQ